MSSGKKVFVGNLNYETQEDDLKDAFSKAGKVVEAKVVRRGYRSKGYGFVEFETEDQAKKAVEILDKSTLNDRSINVQLSTSTGTKVGNMNNRDMNRSYDNRSYDNRSYDNRSYENRSYDNRSYGPPRRGYGRPPPYRNSYYQGRPRGGPGGRRMYYLRNDNGNNRRWNNNRPQRRYNKPQRQTNVEKVESKTTIFVANLPFSVDDEGLVELFSKCGQIRTAHVVRNKGRSKGFGFVEFVDQEGQTKALKEMENHSVPYLNGEQKNLSVKIAMAEVEVKETEKTTPKEEDE